jgi:hypothetical protein
VNSNNFSPALPIIVQQKKILQTSDNFRKKIFYLKVDIPLADNFLKERINKKITNQKVIKKILMTVFHNEDADIENITYSTLHSVFHISFQKERFILKINNFSDIHNEAQFLQEQWLNNLLMQSSLSSLPIVYIDVSRYTFPFDFIIMKEAQGKSLHNWKLGKKKEKEIFLNLGKSIAKIHSL